MVQRPALADRDLDRSSNNPDRERLLEHVQHVRSQPDLAWPLEYHGAYQERRRECGLQLYSAVGVARGDTRAAEQQRLENFRFFGAPHVAIMSTDQALGTYGAVDCGAYVANFALAARSLGVAAIAQGCTRRVPGFLAEATGPERGPARRMRNFVRL